MNFLCHLKLNLARVTQIPTVSVRAVPSALGEYRTRSSIEAPSSGFWRQPHPGRQRYVGKIPASS